MAGSDRALRLWRAAWEKDHAQLEQGPYRRPEASTQNHQKSEGPHATAVIRSGTHCSIMQSTASCEGATWSRSWRQFAVLAGGPSWQRDTDIPVSDIIEAVKRRPCGWCLVTSSARILSERCSMPTAFLITHPEVSVDPALPVPAWRLSDRGVARMTTFAGSGCCPA